MIPFAYPSLLASGSLLAIALFVAFVLWCALVLGGAIEDRTGGGGDL